MKTTLHRALLILVAASSPIVTNCAIAPERAKAIREDKALTLGLPLGAIYRPNGKIGLGTGYSGFQTKEKAKPEASSDLTLDASSKTERELSGRETDINAFIQYFPWDTSSFFFGAGATYRKSKLSYQETVAGSTLTEDSTNVSLERTSTSVGVPVGWCWIWQPGFTFQLAATPSVVASRKTTLSDDGTDGNVDQEQRDRTLKGLAKNQGVLSVSAGLLIGWSF